QATRYLLSRSDLAAGYTLARQLYQAWQQRLGDDHPHTLNSAYCLAWAYFERGDHDHARRLGEDTLNRKRRVLGEDHPHTLRSATGLAADLRELGEVDEALALDQDTLTRCRRVLGEDHPHTLRSATGLAADLR